MVGKFDYHRHNNIEVINMKNEFCHDEMKCQKNCPCADKDGICHCKMVNSKECVCKSHCKEQEK